MKGRIGIITLGVDDSQVSLKFYRDGSAFKPKALLAPSSSMAPSSNFNPQHGVKLTFFPRSDIAPDADIATTGRSPTEFTLGHNVGSESEVDALMRQAIAAGPRLLKPARKTFWGG